MSDHMIVDGGGGHYRNSIQRVDKRPEFEKLTPGELKLKAELDRQAESATDES